MHAEACTRALAPWSAAVLWLLSGCHARATGPTATAAPRPTPTPTMGCLPSHDGYLRARLRGARDLDIDWNDTQMQCDGGARPEGRGIRLTFVGRIAEHPLRFVFGIDVPRDSPDARDLPANVTLIFEGQNAVYSTQGDSRCTVDELSWGLHAADAPRRVVARGFCVAPAGAVGAGQGILVSRFDFAGRLPAHD